ncbi:flagellar biosynthetic protein FliO [Bartonella rattaustraliani]|uniref:flagellar biosynthetic protein FliO n=1 Tax=Bartonella rattaustraliani TaxID=481139 RepID=UPI0003765C94|nr:flagellar biosynthetic protein FliO [Bartonella rattaustraliani]
MYIWLSNQLGTSAANIIMSFVFFIITITAVAAIVLFLRRLNTGNFKFKRNTKKRSSRLTLCETIVIDRTRRLILIRCDDKEHLLLIGGLTDVVVESNILNASGTQHRQPTLTTTETNSNSDLAEKSPFSVNEKENTQRNDSAPFMKQNVEDSAISAKIEGRQEPSLFIPDSKKQNTQL